MQATKPSAALSFDLDNKWTYLKTHGDPSWQALPSYLDRVVPRVLEFLRTRNLTITFFLVGQDAALERNHEVLGSLSAAGHEIGNHTFHHDPWLHLYTEQEIDHELELAEEHIERATGQRPVGFRGPGFSLSPATLRTLGRRGYLYDATTIPTFIGPLGRAYFLMHSRLSPEQRLQRKALYGNVRDALQPNRPYRWRVPTGELMELPTTTMPFLKAPIHVSYILYLSMFSRRLARAYFRTALTLCRAAGVPVSLLLHPLDFLGFDDLSDLRFFPGMSLSSGFKLEVVDEVLSLLSAHYRVQPLRRHVVEIETAGRLPSFDALLTGPSVT